MRIIYLLIITIILSLSSGCGNKATGKSDTQNGVSSNIEVEVE